MSDIGLAIISAKHFEQLEAMCLADPRLRIDAIVVESVGTRQMATASDRLDARVIEPYRVSNLVKFLAGTGRYSQLILGGLSEKIRTEVLGAAGPLPVWFSVLSSDPRGISAFAHDAPLDSISGFWVPNDLSKELLSTLLGARDIEIRVVRMPDMSGTIPKPSRTPTPMLLDESRIPVAWVGTAVTEDGFKEYARLIGLLPDTYCGVVLLPQGCDTRSFGTWLGHMSLAGSDQRIEFHRTLGFESLSRYLSCVRDRSGLLALTTFGPDPSVRLRQADHVRLDVVAFEHPGIRSMSALSRSDFRTIEVGNVVAMANAIQELVGN